MRPNTPSHSTPWASLACPSRFLSSRARSPLVRTEHERRERRRTRSLEYGQVVALCVAICAWAAGAGRGEENLEGGRLLRQATGSSEERSEVHRLLDGLFLGRERLHAVAWGDLAAADRAAELEPHLLEALSEVLLGEERTSMYRRARAAHLLGELGDPRALDPLMACVARKASYAVITEWPTMYQVALSLGRLRDPRALPALEHMLADTREAWSHGGGVPWSSALVPHAAQRAIHELTGEWRHFTGEEVFQPPAIPLRPVRLEGPLGGVAYRQEGTWEEVEGAIRGTSAGVGRLWLPWVLPGEYTLAVHVAVEGGQGGLSYGHLRDFVVDPPGSLELALAVWVSRTDFAAGHAILPHGAMWRGGWLGRDDPRRVLAQTRTDLGRRVALVVHGGTATFSGFDLRRGELVPDILYSRSEED